MRIDFYIEQLLHSHNCVVIPGFGAFLSHAKSAQLDAASHTLKPPFKTISFNSQLTKNDGILVSHIAQEKKLGYEELLDEVEQVAESWKKKLEKGESIELFNIGRLSANKERRIQFQPENKINYLTSSFGLSSLTIAPVEREVLKEEVEELEEKIPFIITPEKRAESSFRPWLKYAAIVFLSLSLGVTSYRTYGDLQEKQVAVQQEAQEEVSRLIQEATFFESDPLELPAISLNVTKRQLGKHHVIAGAFRIAENADKRVAQLKKKGYNAFYLGQNKYGLHQVAYDSFEDPKKALVFLRKVKATDSRDAWLLSEK